MHEYPLRLLRETSREPNELYSKTGTRIFRYS